MEHKQRHQQYADSATRKLEIMSSKIDTAISALNFLMQWFDEDKVMIAYIVAILGDTKLHHKAILANIERLAELADPTIPEDLPF